MYVCEVELDACCWRLSKVCGPVSLDVVVHLGSVLMHFHSSQVRGHLQWMNLKCMCVFYPQIHG